MSEWQGVKERTAQAFRQEPLWDLLGVQPGREFRADLHAHTTLSDGSDSFLELMGKARVQGVTHLAVTNHDTTVGLDAIRQQAAEHGKIFARCIPKRLFAGLFGCMARISCQSQLVLDTWRRYVARKGRFSLHGPLESCTARRSCHPPPNSASDRSHGAALMGGGTGRGRLLVGQGDAAKGVRGVVGCRALAAKLASVKLRLQVSDADNLAESR